LAALDESVHFDTMLVAIPITQDIMTGSKVLPGQLAKSNVLVHIVFMSSTSFSGPAAWKQD
jgi:hypothetical protein